MQLLKFAGLTKYVNKVYSVSLCFSWQEYNSWVLKSYFNSWWSNAQQQRRQREDILNRAQESRSTQQIISCFGFWRHHLRATIVARYMSLQFFFMSKSKVSLHELSLDSIFCSPQLSDQVSFSDHQFLASLSVNIFNFLFRVIYTISLIHSTKLSGVGHGPLQGEIIQKFIKGLVFPTRKMIVNLYGRKMHWWLFLETTEQTWCKVFLGD